jgi:hypothetical protein
MSFVCLTTNEFHRSESVFIQYYLACQEYVRPFVENEGLFYEPGASSNLSHINPFHTHAPRFFKMPFCIILPHMLHLSISLFLLHYLVKILCAPSGQAQDMWASRTG